MKSKILIIVAAVTVMAAGGYALYAAQPVPAVAVPAEHVVVTPAAAQAEAPQVIEITAKVGYTPLTSMAKANTPTIIRVSTNSTFDCSAAVTIPALGYRARLPMTGSVDIDVPPQAPGTELNGVCGMGMYSFVVKFS